MSGRVFSPILLAVATAFLTVFLGALATKAPPSTLVAFLLFAAFFGGASVVWEWRPFRAVLPFAQPFAMRIHGLWVEMSAFRDELAATRGMTSNGAPGVDSAKAVDLEGRMWSTICAEWAERGPLLEDGHGSGLASDRSLSEADLYQRVVNLKAMLGSILAGQITG